MMQEALKRMKESHNDDHVNGTYHIAWFVPRAFVVSYHVANEML